ncbi:MAG: hypothetical protein C1O27_001566 [Chloroflexi bacterium]|nr:MAG: hypothetical protein C1O27_001566 [Chloroflexota bacterium]
MIQVSVMYANTPGARFDFDYYNGPHVDLVRRTLEPAGLVELRNLKGIGGGEPGSEPPYLVIGLLTFNTMEDIPNYTDLQPIIQVNEVMP